MIDWMETTLGEVTYFVNDKISIKDISLYNYVSTENLLADKLGVTNATSIPNIPKVNHFKEEDVLFSNIRTYFKKVWSANKEGGASNDVLIFRPNNNDVLNNKFLFYFISSDFFIDYTVKSAKGTKMPRGDKNAIKLLKFSLPPLQEQKAIANVLTAFDNKIELLQQQNITLETLAQTIFKEWFVSKEKTDWKKVKIKDFNAIVTDYVANGSFASLAENVTYIREKDYAKLIRLTDFNNGFSGDFVYVDEKAYKFLNKSKLNGSEIIISNVGAYAGTVFKCPQLNSPMTLGPNSIVIKSNFNNYFYLLFTSRIGKHYLDTIITGSAQPKFNKTAFRDLKLSFPSESYLVEFEAVVSPFMNKIEKNKIQIQSLTKTRDTLLPKLMSGQVRVKM